LLVILDSCARRAWLFREVGQSSVAARSESTVASIQMYIKDTTIAVQWIQIEYAAGPGDWLGCKDGRGTKA